MNLYLITFEIFMLITFVVNLYIFIFRKYNICMLLFYCITQLIIIFLNIVLELDGINNWLHCVNIILIYLSIYDICILYKQNRETTTTLDEQFLS